MPAVLTMTCDAVQTNIVIFDVRTEGMTAGDLVDRWRASGVLSLAIDERRVRTVTHYDVSRAQVDTACERLAALVEGREEEKGAGPKVQ